MISRRLVDLADATWAVSLGCDVNLVRQPGAHLVPGGAGFRGFNAVYMARIHHTVLVYCPEGLRPYAGDLLSGSTVDEVFTRRTLERIAGGQLEAVQGPAWHGFVDDEHFIASTHPEGVRLAWDDTRLAELSQACGEESWAEAGFSAMESAVYGLVIKGQLVAAGIMRPFRGQLADVGLITHPDHRGQGLARRLASRMITDALPDAQVVRYRALTTNAPSLALARSLGFVGRGQNLFGRLRELPVGRR